jgi:predicted transcriptional regulator
MPNSSSKFYHKSLTLLLPILKMISQGYTITEISKSLNENKSLVSYYVKKATGQSYVKEIGRDVFKRLELTQAGKNFLEEYTNDGLNNIHRHTCRLENIRFEATVHRMPTIMIDWKKTEMNNWAQGCRCLVNVI